MKKPSQRMQTLVKLAQINKDQAAKSVAQARQVVGFEQQRLDELVSYHRDYEQATPAVGAQQAKVLANYHQFVQRLSLAIAGQLQTMVKVEDELAQQQQQWLACQHRCQSLEKLQQKLHQQEDAVVQKQEQKQLEEQFNSLRNYQNI